jgi:type I restriction enzyme S subunit
MSVLEKLLEGVEVEWKTLGEVCEFQNGFAFQSSLFK